MSDQPNLELLHENRHIPNVTGWSDWLVAQRLPELTAIDCALLLMSAVIDEIEQAETASSQHGPNGDAQVAKS